MGLGFGGFGLGCVDGFWINGEKVHPWHCIFDTLLGVQGPILMRPARNIVR